MLTRTNLSVFGPMPPRRWAAFTGRNGRPMTYHADGDDWIRNGKALCGKDTSRTGWETTKGRPTGHQRACKRCDRIARERGE